MSATQQTLAQMVRSKYPGAYDDLDDVSLEKAVLAKHPEYSDLPTTKTAPTLAQKAESWYTTPTETPLLSRNTLPGRERTNMITSPRDAAQSSVSTAAMMAAPLAGPAAMASPVAAGIGLAGAVGGGVAGEKVGQYVGEKVGAPELGGDVGGLAGSFFGGMAGPAAARLRIALSKSLYTPTGELTPLAKAAVHPTELPETLLRKVVPPAETATFPGASEPSAGDFYEQKGQDLMKRQAQQDVLDRRAAAQQRFADKQAAVVANSAPKPGPFEGATSTAPKPATISIETDSNGTKWAVPSEGTRVTIPKGMTDADIPSYAASKIEEQRQGLAALKKGFQGGDIPKGSSSPFTSSNPQYANLSDLRGTAPDDLISRTKTLVRPGEAPSASDLKRAGDLTQVPLTKLRQLAQWGDELAKNEILRRLRQ